MKININLYEKLMNTLEVGRVFSAEKIRKFNMKKDGKLETRLQTSKYSVITEAPKIITSMFKNVSIADQSVDGTIIGFTNICCYYSCSKHWNKIDENGICLPCGKIAEESKFDFKAELLLETDADTEEIKNYLIFKRVATMITTESNEEAVENKLIEYEGSRCTVEHNNMIVDEENY